MSKNKTREIVDIKAPESYDELTEAIVTDKEIILCIKTLTPDNERLCDLIAEDTGPVAMKLKEAIRLLSVKDGILYNNNHIEVPKAK